MPGPVGAGSLPRPHVVSAAPLSAGLAGGTAPLESGGLERGALDLGNRRTRQLLKFVDEHHEYTADPPGNCHLNVKKLPKS